MNDRSGLLTLAAYLTAAMAIVLVAALGILQYGAPSPMSGLDLVPAEPAPEFAVAHFHLAAEGESGSSTTALERQRTRLLESMLADKTRRLQELTHLLKQQNEEYADLRRQYDDAMLVAVQSLAQPSEPINFAAESELRSPSASAPPPAQLEAQLSLAQAVHEATLNELESLQDELARAYDELGRTREAAAQESSSRLREALVLEAAAASAMLRVGKEAVPALKEALLHNSAVVRRWAASVLAGIGSDAGEAVVALTEALADPDPSVRDAAKTALDAIER